MSRTLEPGTTTGADSAGKAPALPPAHVRVTVAFASGVLGWLLAGAASFAFDRFLVQGGGSATGDMLVFVLLIGAFVAGAWTVSVLPLVLFGDHGSWIFRPLVAPLVGASCGVLLLVLENWVFFDFPPWQLIAGGLDFSEAYLLALAGVVGAVTWTIYTVAAQRASRRLERRM